MGDLIQGLGVRARPSGNKSQPALNPQSYLRHCNDGS